MTFLFELKYALRLITKKSGHSAMCILVIAMSLGLSLVVFSLTYNTTYKQLDFVNSDRWVYATNINLETGFVNFADSLNPFTYQEMQESVSSFEEFGAMQAFAQSRFSWDERTTIFNTVKISPHLLQASAITPVLGRTLLPSDEDANSQETVLLSNQVWQNYFASDPNIVGQQTRLNEVPHTIIGVMPENVSFPVNFDLMVPLKLERVATPSLTISPLTPIGIMADGVNISQANNEIQTVMTRLRAQHPNIYPSTYGAVLRPINTMFMETGDLLFTAMAATSLIILFLACLNIANLLLSRGMERDQEFAIRNAVGSTRWVLIRQSLIESLVICLIGTIVGLLIAQIGLVGVSQMFEAVDSQIPSGLPNHWVFTLDSSVLISSVVFTAAIWLASSFMPAWISSKPNVDEILKSGSKGTTDKKKFRFSKALVGFEIFSSCFLLVLCGGLLFAIDKLLETDYGFELENRMVSDIEFPEIGYEDPASYTLFFEELTREAELNPNIEQLAVTSSLPFSGGQVAYTLEDSEPVAGVDFPRQWLISVSNNFFQTVEVDILEGRSFDSSDTRNSLAVVIVDEEFARSNWPAASPLGKRVQINPQRNGPFYTIIGVSSNTKQSFEFVGFSTTSSFYRPWSQRSLPTGSLIVKTSLVGKDYLNAIQDSIARVDASVAVHKESSFAQYFENTNAGIDLIGKVFLAVAMLTVVLAGTGIFAIISRSVTQRIRETGIRRALGSTNGAIVRMYLRQGLVYLGVGVFFGGGFALLATNAMTIVFSELMSYVPLVLGSVVLGMTVLIGLASWLPSRQAVAMEPGEALHYE